MPDDIERLRLSMRAALPARIRAALDGYERFTADEPPADAKGFATWHAAAKAALAHVEVLVKLARWSEGRPEAIDPAETGIENLLAQARSALNDFAEDDPEEDL
jgi:hypothetical protein